MAQLWDGNVVRSVLLPPSRRALTIGERVDCDFHVPAECFDAGAPAFAVVERENERVFLRLAPGIQATVERRGRVLTERQLFETGMARKAGEGVRLELLADARVRLEMGGLFFSVEPRSSAGFRLRALLYELEGSFLSSLGLAIYLGVALAAGALLWVVFTQPPSPSLEPAHRGPEVFTRGDDRVFHLVLAPEPEPEPARR